METDVYCLHTKKEHCKALLKSTHTLSHISCIKQLRLPVCSISHLPRIKIHFYLTSMFQLKALTRKMVPCVLMISIIYILIPMQTVVVLTNSLLCLNYAAVYGDEWKYYMNVGKDIQKILTTDISNACSN